MSFRPPHRAIALAPFWRNRLLLLLLGVGCLTSAIWNHCATPAQAQDSPQPLRRGTDPAPTQPTIWVNSQTGNDAKADGSEQAPFRTLTRALEQAQPNTLIQLAPGTYSTDTGEVFPILLKSNVTVQGNPDELGQGVVIRGGGSYTSPSQERQNVALVLARQSTLAGLTVTNPTVRGHGIWVESGNPIVRDNTLLNSTQSGLVIAGSSTPEIQNNLFLLNRVSGLTVTDSARPTIADNVFQRTGSGLMVSKDAAPRIVSNRISQNRDGIVIQDNARPILRSNTVEDSARDGLIVIAQAQPNLGTPQDPGNNVFLHNRQHDIDALATRQVLPAFGNQFADNRLSGSVDLTGTAPLVGVTTVASAASQLPVSPTRAPSASRAASAQASLPITSSPITSSSIASSPIIERPNQADSLISAVPSAASTLISSLPPSSRPASTQAGSAMARRNSVQLVAAANLSATRPTSASPASARRTPPVQSAPPRPAATQAAAVEINVPPPETTAIRPAAAALLSMPPARSTPAVQPSAAVQIPVPAPESAVSTLAMATASPAMPSVTVAAAPSLPRQTVSVTAPQMGGSPITIPVPPPERTQAARPAPTTVAAANTETRILRVPGGEIPLGNTGDLSTIAVANALSPAALAANRASLQYRVIVAAEDVETQERVRAVIPGAFATLIAGEMVVQVGAFSNRDNAAEVVEQLSQSGLQGIIQPME
jgi:parallel beta-helix repeat protein